MNLDFNIEELNEVQNLYGDGFTRVHVTQYLKWWEFVHEKPYKGCGSCMEKVYDDVKIILLRNNLL